MKSFFAPYLLTQNEANQFEIKKNCRIKINEKGKITAISENESIHNDDKELKHFVIPGLCNAHSHAFQIAMRGYADNPKNFQDWVSRYLYPFVEKFDERSLRKVYRNFFNSLIRNGITTLGEFHYFHHDKALDNRFDELFLEEAKESGIRLSLLYSAYDKGSREAQKRFHHSTDSYIKALENVDEWMNREHLNETWSLSVAPHSLHGCSNELIKESVAWALARDKYWHIHLSEQKHDIDYAKEHYGKMPLNALNDILKNHLNDKCCLVHAVWLNDSEIDLFNEKHMNLIYNPFTNMYLGDGITRTAKMNFRSNSLIALGTDSNNAFNMFTEAKLFESLQRISHLEMGMIDSNTLLSSISSFSGKLLNLKVGKLAADYFADFIEIDLEESLIDFNFEEESVDVLINHLIFSGLDSKAIKDVYVGGKSLA